MKRYSRPRLVRYRSNRAINEYSVSTGVQITKCSVPGTCSGGGGRGTAAPPPWLLEPYR